MSASREIGSVPEDAICAPRDDVGGARLDRANASGARIRLRRLRRRYRLNRPLHAAAYLGSLPAGDQAFEAVIAGRLGSTTMGSWHLRRSPPVVVDPEVVRAGPAAIASHGIAVGPPQIVDRVVAASGNLAARQSLNQTAAIQ